MFSCFCYWCLVNNSQSLISDLFWYWGATTALYVFCPYCLDWIPSVFWSWRTGMHEVYLFSSTWQNTCYCWNAITDCMGYGYVLFVFFCLHSCVYPWLASFCLEARLPCRFYLHRWLLVLSFVFLHVLVVEYCYQASKLVVIFRYMYLYMYFENDRVDFLPSFFSCRLSMLTVCHMKGSFVSVLSAHASSWCPYYDSFFCTGSYGYFFTKKTISSSINFRITIWKLRILLKNAYNHVMKHSLPSTGNRRVWVYSIFC